MLSALFCFTPWGYHYALSLNVKYSFKKLLDPDPDCLQNLWDLTGAQTPSREIALCATDWVSQDVSSYSSSQTNSSCTLLTSACSQCYWPPSSLLRLVWHQCNTLLCGGFSQHSTHGGRPFCFYFFISLFYLKAHRHNAGFFMWERRLWRTVSWLPAAVPTAWLLLLSQLSNSLLQQSTQTMPCIK